MCDFAFKILIVGDVAVCKSFVNDLCISTYHPTMRTQLESCQLNVDGRKMMEILEKAD